MVEWGEGEIEVKKDFMGTISRVAKINSFGVIRYGLYCQITIGWKMNGGNIVFAEKLKTREGLVALRLLAF